MRGGLPSDLSMADARGLFRSDRYALDLFPDARRQELERRALETSTADLWALLAPGVIPSTAWLDAFLSAAQLKMPDGLFWVGHTTVHPSQSQTIFGHALAGIDVRATFGPLSGQSAPLSCWLPGYNHLIPRTLLEHLLADPRYEGSHSEDILWGDIILKLGMTPEWVPDARAQYSATIGVSSFIQRERRLGIQFAALFGSTFHPDLPMQLFGLREMDHGQILEMKSVAPSVRGQLDQLVRSLDGLEHTPVNNDSEDAKANSAVLIHEVAGVLRILAQQTRVLGFLDSL